jgi:phosphatidylinositol mannoside-binding LppM-like protein
MRATLRVTARTIAMCALAMLMTGCIKVDLSIQLHEDNTAGGTMVFAVSRDLLALTGSSADDLLGQITASAGPLPSGVRFQESGYADDTFEGKTYTFQDVPIDAFSQGTTAGETISIKRVGDTFQVTGEVDLTPAATGQLQPGAAQLAKDMELRVAITFPGPVSRQSGGTISGNTVTWTPVFGEKTEIQATGSAIGSGGNGSVMWILLALAILLVVVVVLVLVRSRRRQVAPEPPTETAATPSAPASPAATDDPAPPPPAG